MAAHLFPLCARCADWERPALPCAGAELCPALPAGGSLTRAKDQARIDFLAQARNRALEPLWLNSSMATSTSLLLPHDVEVSSPVHAAQPVCWVWERMYGAHGCSICVRRCWGP